MTHFDVFNGDADGICALHQLRLADPKPSTLITGVKRDIDLVKQISAQSGDSVTVLDVSLDKNREAVVALLENDVSVDYFDHHFAGDIPAHNSLSTHIDTGANMCTGLLVNQYLNHAHLPWAVTAAYGDNLHDAAAQAAAPLDLSDNELKKLEQLGTLLNYNGYGATLEDLFYPPATLYEKIKPYASPFDFISSDTAYTQLQDGYDSDMARALDTAPYESNDKSALFVFPDEAFSRRVSGVYSNMLARQNPERAHALLCELADGAYLISVRAPLEKKEGADELCRQFPTGGGRKAAAGINHLPASDFSRFSEAFRAQFG